MSKDFKSRLELVIRKFGDDAGTVQGAAVHHLPRCGKRSRAKLTFAAARNFEHPDVLLHIAAAAELIHEASIVHDDIQDRTLCVEASLLFGKNTAVILRCC